jgi:hypothetical protein
MPSLTINQFCAAENISRRTYYNLCDRGEGPRTYLVGNSPRISPEAHREWREQRENASHIKASQEEPAAADA